MKDLQDEYAALLSAQEFGTGGPDYSLMETRHRPALTVLAEVLNSAITVFDMYARKHLFMSHNFYELFGDEPDSRSMASRIHPDDAATLLHHAVRAMRFAMARKERLTDYKFITEYRVRNASGRYVRVTEQQSVLETDPAGNAWLALSVLDLSPDQSEGKPVSSAIYNMAGHTCIAIRNLSAREPASLSPRETQILQLIRHGRLSKEISEQLRISVHTVNTHRRNILVKLNAGNSFEAIRYASEQGLLG
ncbi:MAG: LuxR C-terminal-related transcriptional regulator [Tannerellaceae bacterium]|jgi:DNA-binding CsgD family transcriptional regulator|nr:LuxR C-terminal-related transcriptional regulator [Tannerellaceae bacterium]